MADNRLNIKPFASDAEPRKPKPFQLLALGFLSYAVIGTGLLSLPLAQASPVRFVDNVFSTTSAISTTGLTTISVVDSYTFFGQLVLLLLFQLGGIGYMTVSSFVILAQGNALSESRIKILSAQFPLPKGFQVSHFVVHVVVFTALIETAGAALLYGEFAAAGVKNALWSAVFHSVSAFSTAGFSLFNNNLEGFRGNGVVNLTICLLCYLGAIGFIVMQDVFLALRHQNRRITFTSEVILTATALVLLVGVPLFIASEPSLQSMPWKERIYAATFQLMGASSTSGFNTVPIGQLSSGALTLIIVAMVIGASPSGTGGGIKTTSLSALLAILTSCLRGRSEITFFRRRIPANRLNTAVASTTLYVMVLVAGVFLLSLTERQDYLKLIFEAASALGTVGLSMGITAELSDLGKWLVTALMFFGRIGPLTLGLALFHSGTAPVHHDADLAT